MLRGKPYTDHADTIPVSLVSYQCKLEYSLAKRRYHALSCQH